VKLSTFSCALAACLLTSSVYAAGSTTAGSKDADTVSMNSVMAYLRQQETTREAIELAMAPIKSRADLQQYLAEKHIKPSPLDTLSPAAKQRFISSLKFNEHGITTFDYRDLEAGLTSTQIYRVLALFGVQHDSSLLRHAKIQTPTDRNVMSFGPIFQDHQDYECSKRATCSESIGDICTSNC
jgi:hypothetical protein